MSKTSLWQDIKTFLSSWLRRQELRSVGDDEKRVLEVTEASENETLRKWLWIISIAAAPICFIVLPLVLSVLGGIFPAAVTEVLWSLVKLSMLVEMGLFGLAIWFTWSLNRNS